MNKPLKIGLIAAGVTLVIFITAAILLVVVVDPNKYKDDIAKAVKNLTGRELVFEGDISFNFFPWLGLEVGPMVLGNAPGFTPKEMVRINKAEANIRIIPLLSGNVAIGTVVLDGFTLNLAVNKRGVSNWDDLAKGDKAGNSKPSGGETWDLDGTDKTETLSVRGIEITNANIVYDNQKTGKKSALANLNLIVGEVGDKLSTPFELTFELKNDEPKIDNRPRLTGVLTFDQIAETSQITDLTLDILNLRFTGAFFTKSKDNNLNYSAEIRLTEFSAKGVMEALGMEPIITADPNALTRISADVKINGTPDTVSLEGLTFKLDDTTLTSTGAIRNMSAPIPAIVVKTNIDTIDIDRYLPPKSESKAGESQPAKPAGEGGPAEEPDLSALKSLDLDTRLIIGKVKVMNAHVSDILCEMRIKDGVVTTRPFSAKLYDGLLSAESVLDVNPKIATWTERANLKGVQAGPFLKDMTGKDHLHGTTVVKYDINGAGITPDNIKKSISGTASFAFTDGAINGINVARMLRDTWNKLKGKSASPDEPNKTDFAELLGSAVIKKGHITNNDLLMKSPLLRVTGKGWADLPENTVDYLATVTVVATLKGQDGESMEDLKGLPLPIYAKGSLDNPSIGLDGKAMAEALLKGTFKKGTKELEQNLKETILGDETKDGQKKGGLLKGLFKKE